MLNGIKAMIKEKQEFLEASQMILEDAMDLDMDDSIVLGEEAEDDEDNNDNLTGEENGSEENIIKPDEEEPTLPEEPTADPVDHVDEPLDPVTDKNNDLPTPVGAQTGLPITGDEEDILDATVDLKTNTLNDVLPIPPANANEAIAGEDDDILSQKVDSGFGGETNETEEEPTLPEEPTADPVDHVDEPLEEPVDEPAVLENTEEDEYSYDKFLEAIELGGPKEEPKQDDTTEDATATEQPSENTDPNAAPDAGMDDTSTTEPTAEESPVTSAVKDKVAEAETPVEPDGVDISGDNENKSTNDEIFKKLSSLTKNIEDAKKLVLDSMNK